MVQLIVGSVMACSMKADADTVLAESRDNSENGGVSLHLVDSPLSVPDQRICVKMKFSIK